MGLIRTSYWKSWQKAMWRATSLVVAVLALYFLYLHREMLCTNYHDAICYACNRPTANHFEAPSPGWVIVIPLPHHARLHNPHRPSCPGPCVNTMIKHALPQPSHISISRNMIKRFGRGAELLVGTWTFSDCKAQNTSSIELQTLRLKYNVGARALKKKNRGCGCSRMFTPSICSLHSCTRSNCWSIPDCKRRRLHAWRRTPGDAG